MSKVVNDRLIPLTNIYGKRIAVDARSIVMVEEVMNGTKIYVVNMTAEGLERVVKESLVEVVNAMTVVEQGLFEDAPDTSWVDTTPQE